MAKETTQLDNSELPFAFNVLESKQLDNNQLPFAFSVENGTTPTPPTRPKLPMVAGCIASAINTVRSVSSCADRRISGMLTANCYEGYRTPVLSLSSCYHLNTKGFIPLASCSTSSHELAYLISKCLADKTESIKQLSICTYEPLTPSVGYSSCTKVDTQSVKRYSVCVSEPLTPVVNFSHCLNPTAKGQLISNCDIQTVQKSVPVPCRFYPIPEKPVIPEYGACGLPPPSDELPFYFKRSAKAMPSDALPFPFICWHDEPSTTIPNLGTYIVHNTITATVGGINVSPISFNIKTDMNSYCWQGSVEINPTDYNKVKHLLAVERGKEPLISVIINSHTFTIIAEEQSRNRQFVNHTHSLGGRSIATRLGEDYAKPQSGLLDEDNYASQIVNQQLMNLPITVERWQIPDWLIPANNYAVSGKTPISVINEVANAGGGFVYSHPYNPTLSIKKRWKKSAWELATATPDVILPLDVVRQISDKKRINPRYNTVTLTSADEGGIVYREQQSRDLEAPILDNALYTDRDAIISAGSAILSESGTHSDNTITLRWTDKYNVPLAELGQIWQINDTDGGGAWRGVVTNVSVSVTLENDAPTVWQTIGVDRYLDL